MRINSMILHDGYCYPDEVEIFFDDEVEIPKCYDSINSKPFIIPGHPKTVIQKPSQIDLELRAHFKESKVNDKGSRLI